MRNIEDFGGFEKITQKKQGRKAGDSYRNRPNKAAKPPSSSGWLNRGAAISGHRARPHTPQDIHIGDVVVVEDLVWGFDNPRSKGHPGVCAHSAIDQEIPFLKGTDEVNLKPHYRATYILVLPSPNNGLEKVTAFYKKPHFLRFNRIRNYFPERHLGQLDEDDQRQVMEVAASFLAEAVTTDNSTADQEPE